MEKLRVLSVLSRVPYPPQDGGALGQWLSVEILRRHPRIDYGVVAMNTTRHYAPYDVVERCFDGIPHWVGRVDNRITLPGAALNLLKGEPYHIDRFRSEDFEKVLREALQSFQPHLTLVEGLPPLLYLDTIAQQSRVVYRAHNIEHLIWERFAREEANPARRWYLHLQAQRLKKFEQGLFADRRLRGIVTFTTADAEFIRRSGYQSFLHVAPFAVEVERYIPATEPEAQPTLFHIGSLEWLPNRQGLEWFIDRVLPLVRASYPSVEFHIAGRCPEGYQIPHREGIYYHGVVPDAQKFMRCHSILVVPLLAGSGIRVKIIEAMAMGKAIVSTSVGAEGIECESGRHLLLADTAEDFAAAVCKCLGSPELTAELGRNARTLAETRYNFPRVAEELVEFLFKVAEQ